MSLAVQRSGGPSLGHSLRSPVSVEMPVREGPRHCGQSPGAPVSAGDMPNVSAMTPRARTNGREIVMKRTPGRDRVGGRLDRILADPGEAPSGIAIANHR